VTDEISHHRCTALDVYDSLPWKRNTAILVAPSAFEIHLSSVTSNIRKTCVKEKRQFCSQFQVPGNYIFKFDFSTAFCSSYKNSRIVCPIPLVFLVLLKITPN
jgi:hypothetical protein